jgi:hypothetical protein
MQDIIKKLCQTDRTKRLGCVKNGVAGIKKHKFFKVMCVCVCAAISERRGKGAGLEGRWRRAQSAVPFRLR